MLTLPSKAGAGISECSVVVSPVPRALRYIALFFKGTYSLVSFYELIKVSLAGLMHFLR